MSPARIAWSRITDARSPEAHTLLIVSEETSFGIPALICACREGICPWPACRTWPITTCSTCSGSTPARSRAAPIARPPSSVASSEARPPPILPMGVRAAPRITDFGMGAGLSCGSIGGRGRMVVDACGSSPGAPGPAGRPASGPCAGGRARGPAVRGCPARAGAGACACTPGRLSCPPMRVSSSTEPGRSADADTVAVGVFAGEPPPPQAPAEAGELISSGEARSSFKGLALAHAEGRRWLLVGLGERSELTAERARVAAAVAGERAREISTRTLCWEVPPGAGEDLAERVAEAALVAEAVNSARDLQNRPGNDLTPSALGEYAHGLAAEIDGVR